MLQLQLQLIGGCALALSLVYLYYCNFGVDIRSRFSKRFTKSVPLQFAEVHNKFGERVPVCGHIRPGEWQCNCKTKPCSVLVRMRENTDVDAQQAEADAKQAEADAKQAEADAKQAEADAKHAKLEITDRRGLIAAQKARKRNGR